MSVSPSYRYLAHFIGPKGENESLLEDLLTQVLMDYTHWRRNYFPQDNRLISPSAQRELEGETDHIYQNVHKMLAGLRRSFPFYSPRYIAHQQSETSIASIIGTLAGALYNSNNVTPESGTVTVDWEIEACNTLLMMLGFTPPPDPPRQANDIDAYHKELEKEFAWCHLTSGGTVANIEALWVARAVRYFPLAVRDACIQQGIDLDIKTPSGSNGDIRKLQPLTLIQLKPNESIYLLGKFVSAIRKAKGCDVTQASKWAWDWIDNSDYSPANGIGKSISDFPPVILASGAAHYSVKKAADLLGMGRNAVEIVDMDSKFRMDVRHLSSKLEQLSKQGKCIISVIAVAGTTEEGAVDPIHHILDLRRHLEVQNNQSFWLHVDAAWGGYLRSLYVYSSQMSDMKSDIPRAVFLKRVSKLGKIIDIKFDGDFATWAHNLVERICSVDSNYLQIVQKYLKDMLSHFQDNNFTQALESLKAMINAVNKGLGDIMEKGWPSLYRSDEKTFGVDRKDLIDCVGDFVSEDISLQLNSYKKDMKLRWADHEVGMSICAIERANSITIDPHKMGYGVYPCGAVAFKNDRIRHFITQQAPYITSSRPDVIVHKPPRHLSENPTALNDTKISTFAFAPFTLEGSRPSTAACSLWLASKTLPFNQEHHGTIVRSSLLSARYLYEWIVHWKSIMSSLGVDTDYEFVPYVNYPPDTNIVIFGIKKKSSQSISKFNDLTIRVYNHFTIQSELGEREYSYSQPFFLSKTWFRAPSYPYSCVKTFIDRCRFRNARPEYEQQGLVVLRATVMNPYLLPLQTQERQDLIRDFVRELHSVAVTESMS